MDLWLEPFTPIDQGALSVRGACPRPGGGQTVQSTKDPPLVAFIVTMYNNGLTAAQCLLELFRRGHSTHPAFILLCILLRNLLLHAVKQTFFAMVAFYSPADDAPAHLLPEYHILLASVHMSQRKQLRSPLTTNLHLVSEALSSQAELHHYSPCQTWCLITAEAWVSDTCTCRLQDRRGGNQCRIHSG